MYILSFLKSCFDPKKFLSTVYFIMNAVIVFLIFMYFQLFDLNYIGSIIGIDNNITNGIMGLLINFVVLLACLSPIGEAIMRWKYGAKKVVECQENEPLLSIFNDVYKEALKIDPKLKKNIKLYYVNDDAKNAFALGRHTIIINSGLLSLEVKDVAAILAHEFGHISMHDCDMKLAIMTSNSIILAVIVITRVVMLILNLFFNPNKSGFWIANFFRLLFDVVISAIFVLWSKLGMIMINFSSRKQEYRADDFAARCGYALELISAFNKIEPVKTRMSPISLMYATHPNTVDRINRLKVFAELDNAQ